MAYTTEQFNAARAYSDAHPELTARYYSGPNNGDFMAYILAAMGGAPAPAPVVAPPPPAAVAPPANPYVAAIQAAPAPQPAAVTPAAAVNPYVAAIQPAPAAVASVAPAPVATPPASGFNSQAYAAAHPDLSVNWQRAHDPAWIAANPGSAATVAAITKYPTLDAYLQADSQAGSNTAAVAAPATVAPPPVTTPAAPAFNTQAYAQSRPDLVTNWQRAHDPAWIAANPGAASIVQFITKFPTIDAYLQADSQGSTTPPPAVATPTPAAVTPPPTAVVPPTVTPAPTPPPGSANVRPDLLANWTAAQSAQWGQSPTTNYVKSFPNMAAYAAADAAGNPEFAPRSAATAVMVAVPAAVAPPAGTGTAAPAAGPSAAASAALNAARTAYQSSPGALANYSDQAFLQWWQQNAASGNIEQYPADFALLTALADAGNPQAVQVLDAAGYENTSDTQNLPIEQGLLQTALPGLLGDVNADAGRRTLVDTLSTQAQADYNAARASLSPEANAARLAAEQAQAGVTTGETVASAATAAAEQLGALQSSVAAMQQNLSGDLAAKATALQQQVASFTANLNTFDATQKAALAEQIATTQKDLEDSIGSQRQSLTTEIAALRGAADAQSVARKAALQAEIDGLTAAQAPMAQARLDSANALTTAINLGLESTNDALTAQRAKQGYIGSSSFSDAAQTRATIGARQQAAGVMGSAREANAADTRTIGSRGATEGRTLANEYADNLLAISGREATGSRTLADTLAEGTRAIGDTGAAGLGAIRSATGTGLMNVGNAGAAQQFQDQTMGSTQLRSLLDSLATGSGGIATNMATQQQAARTLGTQARQGYFDNAYTRQIAGTLAQPGLAAGLTNTLTSLGNYGNSGLNRTQGALSWWNTNPNAAPTPGTTPAVVDNSGNDISGLGAGLVGSAFNAANANNWWKTPTLAPGATTTTTAQPIDWYNYH